MDGETEERFRTSHQSIQYQLLTKLSVNVAKYAVKDGMIEDNTHTCGHLEQLLHYLADNCCNIGWYSSKLLYQLVEVKAVCKDYMIASCISQSALGKPIRSSVYLVLRLIQLQPAENVTSIEKHPLSRLLINQEKSVDVIFATIHHFFIECMENDIIYNSNSLQCLIDSLKPFISFLLSDSTHALSMFNDLLNVSSFIIPSFPNEINGLIQLLLSNLSDHHILKKNGLILLPVIQRLGIWYLDHEKYFQDCPLHINIISLLITVCWDAVELKDNNRVVVALNLIKKLIQLESDSFRKTDESRSTKEALIFVCSLLLLKLDESLTLQLLQIIMLLLPYHLESLSLQQAQPLISFLFLPILQILSQKKSSGFEKNDLLLGITENILRNIESYLRCQRQTAGEVTSLRVIQPVNTYSEILNVGCSSIYLLDRFLNDKRTAIAWCTDLVKSYELKQPSHLKENIILTLSSLLVCHYDTDVFREALKAMVTICKYHCNLVSVFLPLLLYLLRSKTHETVKLDILYTFPKIATGKTVISSILKVILSLSESYRLLPVCIMLMTTLWLQQPRVYPYLLQLLNKETRKDDSPELWFELLLTRVTSLLQVCKVMPTTHGEDMVVLISNIMEEVIKESQDDKVFDKCASCLALLVEALKGLCVSQVIDIRSIWKAVVTKVRVIKHSVVLQSLCSLLASFPSLAVEGQELFLEEIMIYLWSLVQHQNAAVVGSAYEALSVFPSEMMKVKHLPEKISVEIGNGLKASKEHKDDEEYDPNEDVCPGFGFMVLLHETPLGALHGFQLFLHANLQQDVCNLPRGIGSRSFIKPVSSTYNQIPVILQTQYESSNRPAVLPGIAAGILCCFEPKIQGMDIEKPANLHLKLLMGRYKLMLDNLLQEFTIRQNDWHQAMLAPRIWTHFMKKLYEAFIKGRAADLFMQDEKGSFDDEEVYKEEMESIKFWARDEITNQLRKASKGTPKLQGNSMFALVGLLNAVTSFEEEDESNYTAPDQYIAMRTWIVKVTDTVLTVFDGNFKSKAKPFQWCQQVSSERSTASSTFSRCCAAICISELVQPLLSIDTNRIMQMIHILRKASLGSANSGSVTQFHFYCFIGWGLLLSRLSQEQFSELAGNEGRNAMLTSLSTMEEIVFKNESTEQVGAVVGYGLAISSLFTHSTQKDSKVHALFSYEKLLQKCTPFTVEDTTLLNNQAFCFALACTTMNAYFAGSIGGDDVLTCAELIRDKIMKNPESPDLHISLGVLCYALLISNTSQSSNFVSKVFDDWLGVLTDRESIVLSKIGCIKGITTACGIDLLLFKLRDPDKFVELPQVKVVIKLLQKLLITMKENSVCYAAAQNLGQLHLISQVRNQGENSNIPQNYNYLKEMSLLRSIFNSLLSAVALGPHSDWNDTIVGVLVSSLRSLNDCRLPPVNWTAVLNPLIRIGYDVNVKQMCIQFAIKFVNMSSSLTRSITAWLQPGVFIKLEDVLQKDFFKSATLYLTCLSNSEQKGLLEILPLAYLSNKTKKRTVEVDQLKCVLELWISVLEMPCSVQSSSAYIMSGMARLIEFMCNISLDSIEEYLPQFARCIYLLMKENWTRIVNEMPSNPKLSSLLQIEILKYVQNIQLEHILNVILLGFQDEDLGIQGHLFQTLFQLSCCQGNLGTIKEVTKRLITQDLFIQNSEGASNIILLILILSSPLGWTVFPYSSASMKHSSDTALTAIKQVVGFNLPTWLSPDMIEKVQNILV